MSLEGKSPEEIAALAVLTDTVMGNPKTRLHFQRLLKQTNPNIALPEVDMEDRLEEAVKPHRDAVAQMQEQNAQREANEAAQRNANALFEALRDDGVVRNRDGFNKLVEYAASKGFQTSESGLRLAASHQEAETQSAEPTPMAGTIDLNQREQHKDLLTNPQDWARGVARSAVDELNARARRPAH